MTNLQIPLLTLAKGDKGKKLMALIKKTGSLTYIDDIVAEVKANHVPPGKQYVSIRSAAGHWQVDFGDADVPAK